MTGRDPVPGERRPGSRRYDDRRPDDRPRREPGRAVTPPTEEPSRPGVVTAAMVLWIVLGVLMVGAALLYALALLLSSSDAGSSPAAVAFAMVLLAAAGIAVVVVARRMGAGSRTARRALTIVGGVLAVVGLIQVTFRGPGGTWFLGFLAGAVLLHLPAARAWFTQDIPPESDDDPDDAPDLRDDTRESPRRETSRRDVPDRW